MLVARIVRITGLLLLLGLSWVVVGCGSGPQQASEEDKAVRKGFSAERKALQKERLVEQKEERRAARGFPTKGSEKGAEKSPQKAPEKSPEPVGPG
jgi:hypothetical protein